MTKKLWDFDNSYEKLPSRFFRKVHLNPVGSAEYVYYNEDLAKSLGLDENIKEESIDVFSGSNFPEGASSISQAYMGDQFGNLVMLGDGRAILVGEILNPEGERFDIQLKGSGRTPFSRGGDGKAVLGPMLKEYLFSEGLHHLNIPTTRSLAVVTTDETVIRQEISIASILTRVAKSHLRVGTFQYGYYQGNVEDLKKLADYTINRHFPHIENNENKYLDFYNEVIKVQSSLIAKWMSVGFVHGVMNTDNMTISGETIDYGPCAFIDEYDLKSVYSSIDRFGRYSFGNQPEIAFWNLGRFGESLIPLISDDKIKAMDKLNSVLKEFGEYFYKDYYTEMSKKFGIFEFNESDIKIIDKYLKFLEENNLDYTNSFIDLTFQNFEDSVYETETFKEWKNTWLERINSQGKSKEELEEYMKNINPSIIPRNYWVKKSIDEAEGGDFTLFNEFLEALKNPFAHSESQEKFKEFPKDNIHVTFCGT